MAYRRPSVDPFQDEAYHNDYDLPPRHSPSRSSNAGYSVSPVSAYLPTTMRSPSPPSPEEHPKLPHLNSYHQFQAERQQDLRNLSPELGQRRMSAYRQQRQAAAVEMQRQPSPESPVKRKAVPTQVLLDETGLAAPPLPAHTRLDYNQHQGYGYEQNDHVASNYPEDSSTGGIPGLGDRGMSGMVRSISPYRDDVSHRGTSPNIPEQAPPYRDRNYLSASQNTRPFQHSNSSRIGLTAAAAAPGVAALGVHNTDPIRSRGPSPIRSEYGYSADRYSLYSPSLETPNRAVFGKIDPMEIADDDDDPFAPIQAHKQKGSSGGALFGGFGGRDGGGSYGQIGAKGTNGVEKSAWLASQSSGRKRLKWLVGTAILLVVLLGVTGGVIGSIFSKKSSPFSASSSSSSSSSNSSTSSSSTTDNDTTLTKSSAEIAALLNNAKLHKVFPGIDYTPYNAQYPDCLVNPPTQNNVTKDVAVLSQLSPVIRLYGTDCNQTELVLHALDLLEIKSSMKIYIGVWLSANTTTNTRQLDQMYSVLSTYGTDNIAGAIIGNEVLFRKDMTVTELSTVITTVKSNFTTLGYTSLKVGTADLGSMWTWALAEAVDVIGANVHPLFSGVKVADAADWTYAYWQQHDVAVTTGLTGKTNVIAETGWPSGGGYFEGSTAGVDEMNTFLDGWVCDALTNGTEYWWFEAFDEPWKAIYDDATETDGKIETHWGLMDADRNLKDGVVIPDCDGRRVAG